MQRLAISVDDWRKMGSPAVPGEIVRAGRLGAAWRVGQVVERPRREGFVVTLEPVDVHDIPLTQGVRELPCRTTDQEQLQGTLG